MNGGDDGFSATGNLAALLKLTVDGGAGNDTVLGGNGAVVDDLAGTDVTNVQADLAASGGGEDGAPDSVVVNGTNADDVLIVTGAGPNAQLAGLSALVSGHRRVDPAHPERRGRCSTPPGTAG